MEHFLPKLFDFSFTKTYTTVFVIRIQNLYEYILGIVRVSALRNDLSAVTIN